MKKGKEVVSGNPLQRNRGSSAIYDRSDKTTPEWLYRKIATNCAEDALVLEIGCGSGRLADSLESDTGAEVTAVDINPEPISHGPHDQVCQADGAQLPFSSAVFDVVVSIETIEHLPDDQPTQMLSEIARVLTPDGRAFLKTPNRWTHDAFLLANGGLRESRSYHPSLFTHQSFYGAASEYFDVEFQKADLAQYQREKLNHALDGLGKIAGAVPMGLLPYAVQPSICAELKPLS
ncbi:class I SAM-dependent methyltransferase [Haloarcula marina]|uniref:class I SAM-dependent methyltransferase n=1 Tax=Haloarcula marina TaxID=2961574 RepID=UPI0020B78B0D|nr:class I SAM-dependent methyltransferase [Halomicroarcula marina]